MTNNQEDPAKEDQLQLRFIHLRSQGWTYVRLAAELGVCKRTLVNWSRKFQFEINNQRAIELEALQESLLATREARARALAAQLQSVESELAKRDLSELSTARLYALATSLRREILRETSSGQFATPTDEIPSKEFHEHVQEWSA